MKGQIIFYFFLLLLNYCKAQQDTGRSINLPSSFYLGAHITPELSIGPSTTAFAGSAGLDFYKKLSKKLYIKTEFLYAFQKGQMMPYWLKFSDTGPSSAFEGYEKWSLLKIPMTINYFFNKKESKDIYYPFLGVEQAFHLKKYNNCAIGSECHYATINIYSVIGFGFIHKVSRSANFFLEIKTEYNISNVAPIPEDNRFKDSRERENNMVIGVTLGILINKK